MTINSIHGQWLQKRGINPATAEHIGIYSGQRQATGVEPSASGTILVFPYFEGGKVVAEKYRMAHKQFSQRPNPRKTFFNADILTDEALQKGDAALVICEGEMDALAAIEAGHKFAVSVPDGAPPARDGNGNLIDVPEDANDIDPTNDEKFSYIRNNWNNIKSIKRIIIATDNDEPGKRLAAELVRRLDRVRCSFIQWPESCKDLNDVLIQKGQSEVINLIQTAKPYPVSGVYKLSDLPDEADLNPVSTGWRSLDPYLKLFHPALLVVTGRAGHGKSTWTQQLVTNLANLHGWNIAIASFEMRIKPFVADAIASAYFGRARSAMDYSDIREANAWINEQFCFIAPEPDSERSHDIDWLLERAAAAVIRHGSRVLLIDPWNEIEHARRNNETMTEYTNRAVMALKNFARRFDVLVIIVAHPTKSGAAKNAEDMTLYDISDSAAFQNKADLGVVVARVGDPAFDSNTGIFVRKVRYQPETGTLGTVELGFDRQSKLFL